MRIKVSVLAALSGLSLAVISTPALAGGCGFGPGANCDMGVKVMNTTAPVFGPMTVSNDNPMGHLRTINFQRSPHTSITRIHGMAPSASLADAPSGFTNGCHPTSTQYCRANAGTPVAVEMQQPIMSAPIISAPVISAPIISAPVISAPAPVMRTWTGQGYDPAKFQSRQYGENTFTPGIAHIPTSIVDRSPVNAQAVLNSGRTVPQPIVSASNYNFTSASSVTLPDTMAPMASYSSHNYSGNSTPVAVGNNTYASNVAPDGTYWEKTSGVTVMGSTVATQVICKRQLPRQVVNPVVNVPVPVPTRVVNPVIGVPVAVPTPVAVPSAPVCRPAPQIRAPHAAHYGHNQGRYGAVQGSRWVY